MTGAVEYAVDPARAIALRMAAALRARGAAS